MISWVSLVLPSISHNWTVYEYRQTSAGARRDSYIRNPVHDWASFTWRRWIEECWWIITTISWKFVLDDSEGIGVLPPTRLVAVVLVTRFHIDHSDLTSWTSSRLWSSRESIWRNSQKGPIPNWRYWRIFQHTLRYAKTYKIVETCTWVSCVWQRPTRGLLSSRWVFYWHTVLFALVILHVPRKPLQLAFRTWESRQIF